MALIEGYGNRFEKHCIQAAFDKGLQPLRRRRLSQRDRTEKRKPLKASDFLFSVGEINKGQRLLLFPRFSIIAVIGWCWWQVWHVFL